MENDYPSEICKYCTYTNYGESPCGYLTPNGYNMCEGDYCDDAYKNYKKENKTDKRALDELF